MARYYEGVIKRMPDMSMEAYLQAIGLAKFLKDKDANLYEALILIKIREHTNRGYFMNRTELRKQLTTIYETQGLDRAVTVFYSWLSDGLLHIDKTSKGSDLTEAQVIHIVRYNCDFHYRIVRMFHRKLTEELTKLNKLSLKINDNETLKQRLKAVKDNIERVEEPLKRDEPLKTLDQAVIGVKSVIEENNIPEEKIHPEGNLAIWFNGYEMKIVNRNYNRNDILNRDFWWRLHISNEVAEIFEADCKLGHESYSHSCGKKKGKISISKNKDLINKWKKYMIDMFNARYHKNISYNAIVPSESDIIRHFSKQHKN